ncbi:hypothetical protein Bca52824_080213 [Brassica carinata]|uniref:Uncharacterized protein n=1 Tax=Brassica carinata TaxID=52824 RepID=A0A8X7Q4F7_BRACI|nr:hypothetical protein Bca52824_080213 [Brassica carinata]
MVMRYSSALSLLRVVGNGLNKSLMMLENEFGLTCKNAVEKESNKPRLGATGDLSKNQIKLTVSNAYLAYGLGNTLLDY